MPLDKFDEELLNAYRQLADAETTARCIIQACQKIGVDPAAVMERLREKLSLPNAP